MKTENMVLDSSFLISCLFEDDFNHQISVTLMEKLLDSNITFFLPVLVLFEVFHSLERVNFFDDEKNSKKFETFFNFQNITYFDLNMKFFNLFRELPFFKKLKTSDAIIAAGAFLNTSMLISWDKKMVKHSWNAFTPKEFLEKF